MRIEHIAIWTEDLERLKDFYVKYFNASSNDGYENLETGFKSYFLTFDEGARLELMKIDGIKKNDTMHSQYFGYCHLAIKVGTMFEVIRLTETLDKEGYQVIGEARTTGDGYFESVVLDPDGNRIEITC